MGKLKLFIAAALLSASLSMTALAGEWKQDNTGWWYQDDDGTYPVNGLKKIDYYWYYFDEAGYIKTGWIETPIGWYGFNNDGQCLNPINWSYDIPIGGPYEGWLEYNGSYESTLNDLANGRVVSYNGYYWCDPTAYQEEIVYEHDVAPEPLKSRYDLADMQF